MNISVDLGTTYIKTSTGEIFPSGISDQTCMNNNVLYIKGKQYAMELSNDKATYDVNINKGLNQNIRLNFIYALGKSTHENETFFNNVTVALPPSQWENENTVEQFKKILKIDEDLDFSINGLQRRIYVSNISVVPEDALAYYMIDYEKFKGQKALLLGLGSLTLNQILFERDEPIGMHTDEFGVLKVFKDIAEQITSNTGYNVKMEDIENILQHGLFIKGEKQNIDEIINPVMDTYSEMFYRHLKLKWSVDTIPYVLLIGGGGIAMYNSICKYIPHIELLPDAQTIAVKGMGEMAGDML